MIVRPSHLGHAKSGQGVKKKKKEDIIFIEGISSSQT
jgi:hypothetical protein